MALFAESVPRLPLRFVLPFADLRVTKRV
jgi:hypothetical protein